jgi:hypothetical protein
MRVAPSAGERALAHPSRMRADQLAWLGNWSRSYQRRFRAALARPTPGTSCNETVDQLVGAPLSSQVHVRIRVPRISASLCHGAEFFCARF